MTKKVAVFIDGANLYATAKALRIDLDYKRVLEFFGDELVGAYYYTAVIEEDVNGNVPETNPLIPLLDWLAYNGYSVVKKPAKTFIDATGKVKVKGNMDIEIAVDVLQIAPFVTDIWLFSGDGDFTVLVEAAQKLGVRVYVCSTIVTQPPMIADELRRAANKFIEIAGFEAVVNKDRKSRYA